MEDRIAPSQDREPEECSCWQEALNLHRHGRNPDVACSCMDHSPKEWCDCPFCRLWQRIQTNEHPQSRETG